MAKDKPDVQDEVTENDIIEPSETDRSFKLTNWEQVIDLSQAKKDLGLEHPIVPARSLDGETFLLIGAKPFESSYENQEENPYFCDCFNEADEEYFSVVLGGAQPVEIISRYIAAGAPVPIRVTLNFHEGKGKYVGYYTLD